MNKIPKTKIVATIGPASTEKETLKNLAEKGISMFRINCSFTDEEELKNLIKKVKEARKDIERPVAILQDLTGPRIRIGKFKNQKVTLEEQQEFILTTENCEGSKEKVHLDYAEINQAVESSDLIYLDDASIKLKVTEVEEKQVKTKVLIGGTLSSYKGVNIPDTKLSLGGLTEDDKKLAAVGAEEGVDFMAVSFVRDENDIKQLKESLKKKGLNVPGIIPKIERKEALENIEKIINNSDGLMVARGDLGLEIPIERMTKIQKDLIKKSAQHSIPVITATHMLKSMTDHVIPTRAEASDVANAVLDGTDAVMLSEESAIGKHPVRVVQLLKKIVREYEEDVPHLLKDKKGKDVNRSISLSAATLANDLKSPCIVAYTLSGSTARRISSCRPRQNILAATSEIETYRKLALSWGVIPRHIEDFSELGEVREKTKKLVKDSNTAQKEDQIVVTAGIPFSEQGNTNTIMVEEV